MLYLVIIFGLFLLDYTIKNYIVKKWKSGTDKPVLNNRILIRYYRNNGAMLNIGDKHTDIVTLSSVIVLAITFIIFIISYVKKGCSLLSTGLALMVSGGLSNTVDRIKRGYVVDYFSFITKRKTRISKIVFNLGDMFIFAGVVAVFLNCLKKD